MDIENMNDEQLQKAIGLEYTALNRAKKNYEAMKSEWLSRHGREVGAEFAGNNVQVYLAPNNRWDENTARKALFEAGVSDKVVQQMEATVLDRKKAEEMLPPRIYKRCQIPNAPKFMVKFVL